MSEESKRVLELVEMSPCPFCGSNKFRREEITISGIRVGAENHDLNGFSVSCDSCMTSGPFGKSEHEAVEKWNAPQLARQVEALEAELEQAHEEINTLITSPPCRECGAMTAEEAETKCNCSGDKDDCHGCQIWTD